MYSQIFQKHAVSLNQSYYSVSHLNMVIWQKYCHSERQAGTCGEESASVLRMVLTDPVHPETHQEKHPEITSEQFWGERSSDAEPWETGLQRPRERGVQKHLPVWKVPGSHVIQFSKRDVLSLPELLLNSVWVIYPFSCFPEFHRMEMIIFHQRGGGWKEPLHFQQCSKIHKWRVPYGPWKYHLHLAWPPLGLLFANKRRIKEQLILTSSQEEKHCNFCFSLKMQYSKNNYCHDHFYICNQKFSQ